MSSVVYNWYRLGVKIYLSPPEKQDSDHFECFQKFQMRTPVTLFGSPPG